MLCPRPAVGLKVSPRRPPAPLMADSRVTGDATRKTISGKILLDYFRNNNPMSNRVYVEPKGAYDDYQYPVVFLPPYENPPPWIPLHERLHHSDYNNELTQFLPRTVQLKKPSGAQLGFNIRGGKASQLGIFISKVIPDSDADHAGLQEGDQVLAVNDIDFQDIEHSKAVEILKSAKEIIMRVRYFPYNFRRQKERTVH